MCAVPFSSRSSTFFTIRSPYVSWTFTPVARSACAYVSSRYSGRPVASYAAAHDVVQLSPQVVVASGAPVAFAGVQPHSVLVATADAAHGVTGAFAESSIAS